MPRRSGTWLSSLVALAALALAAPASAQLEQDPEEETPPLIEESEPDAEADPEADPEPASDADDDDDDDDDDDVDEAEAQYEPDQRGYEPDQRGYEPDQRGEHDADEQETPPPSPAPEYELQGDSGGAEATSMRAGVAFGDGGSRGFLGGELTLLLGAGGHGVGAIAHDNLVRAHQLGAVYGSLGVRAGVRLGPVIGGLQVDSALESSLHLTRLGLYASTPLLLDGSSWTPTLRLAIGYALATELGEPLEAQGESLVDGLFVDLSVGVRWTIAWPFMLGAELTFGYTHLERGGVACTASCTDTDYDVREAGRADGLSLRLQIFGGVRF